MIKGPFLKLPQLNVPSIFREKEGEEKKNKKTKRRWKRRKRRRRTEGVLNAHGEAGASKEFYFNHWEFYQTFKQFPLTDGKRALVYADKFKMLLLGDAKYY